MILKKFEEKLAQYGYVIKNKEIIDVFGNTVGSMNKEDGFETENYRLQQTLLKLMKGSK